MSELDREQIVKQMQEWCDNMCENACLKGESLNGRVHTCEICFPNTVKNALALIKELTEDVVPKWEVDKARQEGYESGKRDNVYGFTAEELARKVEKLSAENESLKQAMEHEHASFMEPFAEYGEKYERLTEENERLRAEGWWITPKSGDADDWKECSRCGYYFDVSVGDIPTPFCPNCGAKMKGE